MDTMNNYLKKIEEKLTSSIEFEKLEIVDNSKKHSKHKFFSPEKLHLHLKIKSSNLDKLPRVEAQKRIMKILKEDFKTKIHSLQISIEK